LIDLLAQKWSTAVFGRSFW